MGWRPAKPARPFSREPYKVGMNYVSVCVCVYVCDTINRFAGGADQCGLIDWCVKL